MHCRGIDLRHPPPPPPPPISQSNLTFHLSLSGFFEPSRHIRPPPQPLRPRPRTMIRIMQLRRRAVLTLIKRVYITSRLSKINIYCFCGCSCRFSCSKIIHNDSWQNNWTEYSGTRNSEGKQKKQHFAKGPKLRPSLCIYDTGLLKQRRLSNPPVSTA